MSVLEELLVTSSIQTKHEAFLLGVALTPIWTPIPLGV